MFTVTGGEGLAERISALNFLPVVEAEVIRGIRLDTAHSVDANGSTFKTYTDPYKKYLARHGYATAPVTLRRRSENSLLDTLTATKLDEKSSEIAVESSRLEIAKGLSRDRHFMGVSANTVRNIEQKLEDELVRMIQ